MIRTLLLAAAITALTAIDSDGLFASALAAQTSSAPKSAGVFWMHDYDAAFKKARVEGLPLMVFLTMNGEKANEEIARVHMRHPDVVRASRGFVCLVSCPLGEHEQEVGTTGTTGKRCAKFGHVTCRQHAQIERRVRSDLLQTDEVQCPQWIFLASDGKTVLLKHVWALSAVQLRDKMKEAARLAKKGVAKGGRDPRFDDVVTKARGGNLRRRREALSNLAVMEDERVVSFMDEATSSRSARLRRLEAIMAMGESRQERFLPVLVSLLKAKDATTRAHAAVALEKHANIDTGSAIFERIKRENRPDVRANLVRALVACGNEEDIAAAVQVLLERKTRIDRIAALWAAAQVPTSDVLKKHIGSLLKSSSPQIRAAAYFAVGGQQVKAFGKQVSRRAGSERNLAGICARWALGELEIAEYDGDEDPEELLLALLPDNHLRHGELEARRRSRK